MVLELWFVVPSRDTMLGLCADQQLQTDKCGTLTPKMVKNFLVPGPNKNLPCHYVITSKLSWALVYRCYFLEL
jgi:hypothetical protein